MNIESHVNCFGSILKKLSEGKIMCACGNILELDCLKCPKCGEEVTNIENRSKFLFCKGCGSPRYVFVDSDGEHSQDKSCRNCGLPI